MRKMKKFEISDLQCLKKIIGLEFNNIFYQKFYKIVDIDDMIVVNFGKEENYFSLHVPCMVRILKKEKILLTSSDIYFTNNYNYPISDEVINNKDTLLDTAIDSVNELLNNAIVTEVSISIVGDVSIKFNNDILFQIILDCRVQDFEYYRFMEREADRTINHVIEFVNGEIIYSYSCDSNIDD